MKNFVKFIKSQIEAAPVNPTVIAEAVQAYIQAHPVSVVWSAISGKPLTFPAETHTHDISTAVNNAVADYLVANPPTGYTHPTSHPPSIIAETTNDRFISDTEASTWNGKQAALGFTPVADNDARLSDARTPTTHGHLASDITDGPAILEGDVRLSDARTPLAHVHSYEAAFTKLIVSGDKPTGANTTPVTLGISFNYEANKTYVIDFYAMVAPGVAGTGCGFLIDVSSAVTYVGTFSVHQLAATGTVSGGSSIGDAGATAMGVSSGMVGTGSNFVSGSGLLITGANTGTATFFFRSETTAITTCKSGSAFRIMKMN